MSDDFAAVVDTIIRRKPELQPCLQTVEKEILHIEILRSLDIAGLLRGIVFKGGTSLRLCHGGRRLSEDLDFCGGKDFSEQWFREAGTVVGEHLMRRYHMESSLRVFGASLGRSVSRGVLRVVTKPPRYANAAAVAVQRIKIDVDFHEAPAGSGLRRAAFPHADATMTGATVNLRCVPLSSIMTDKLVALPMSVVHRRNPRYRDIWDLCDYLPHLGERESVVGAAWEAGVRAAGRESFHAALAQTVSELPEVIESDGFRDTMRRFLPAGVWKEQVEPPECRALMARTVGDALRQMRSD